MNKERLLVVLKGPHISEKSSIIADKNKHIAFKVDKTATKFEIKKAVEDLFNVKVEQVNVVNTKGKVKRFRNSMGKRNDHKKAYVRLKSGYDIDFAMAE
jgi:large subunit ribosomal protein L23